MANGTVIKGNGALPEIWILNESSRSNGRWGYEPYYHRSDSEDGRSDGYGRQLQPWGLETDDFGEYAEYPGEEDLLNSLEKNAGQRECKALR